MNYTIYSLLIAAIASLIATNYCLSSAYAEQNPPDTVNPTSSYSQMLNEQVEQVKECPVTSVNPFEPDVKVDFQTTSEQFYPFGDNYNSFDANSIVTTAYSDGQDINWGKNVYVGSFYNIEPAQMSCNGCMSMCEQFNLGTKYTTCDDLCLTWC